MMPKKIITMFVALLLCNSTIVMAGSTGSEDLQNANNADRTSECFEGVSRAVFAFNHTLDKAIFKPVAKGYRKLPVPIRKGTSNVIDNLRSLLTFSNNVLQGDFREAGTTAGRFVVNSTIGVLGIWDPAAAAFNLKKNDKEDFGQTLGVWGTDTGCYFVLPILGPTTVRDSVGMIADMFIDPVYQITHDTELNAGIGNENYSEHNYYYYKGAGGVDFRAKNIDSFDSLERNSIDLYASVKSLYLQNRIKKITNSKSTVETQDDSDWEEIDTN